MLSVLVIPRYFSEHFQFFFFLGGGGVCVGNSKKIFSVMLMQSRYHKGTFGHIEFHLAIGFKLS